MRRRLCMWRDWVSSCKQPNVPVLAYHPQECKIARLRGRCLRASCGSCTTPLTEELLLVPSPARCIQDSSGNLAILQSCGWLVLQGIASPARCIQDSPGNLAILQSCGWSVPQCKLRKLAFLMMMKEQSCKLFGRCVWFPVISGGQPPLSKKKPPIWPLYSLIAVFVMVLPQRTWRCLGSDRKWTQFCGNL